MEAIVFIIYCIYSFSMCVRIHMTVCTLPWYVCGDHVTLAVSFSFYMSTQGSNSGDQA